MEWTLIVAALILWIRFRDLPGRSEAIPFLLFGALMLGIMLRVLTTGLRYVLPFLPAFLVFTAIVLSGVLVRYRPVVRMWAVAFVCAAMLLSAQLFALAHPLDPDPHPWRLIAEVKDRNLGSARLLVPHDDLPTLHYYFPDADLTAYDDAAALPSGEFDAIVHAGDPVKIDVRKQE